MAIVYRHIRKDTKEVFYIGIGKSLRRAYRNDSRNPYWENIAKNGYETEILFENISWEEACRKEVELICFYGRKDIGTGILSNMTNGGDGVDFTPEVRKKISDALKENNPVKNEKTKEKISKTLKEYFKTNPVWNKGKTGLPPSWNKGKKMSSEFCQKLSEQKKGKTSPRKGVKLSDSTKEKLRKKNLGKVQSQETINKRVEKLKGQTRSEESKFKMKQAWIKRKQKLYE